MIVGVLKEIKDRENRIALTPKGAKALVKAKHTVLVEKNAGLGSGFSNKEYRNAGAKIVSSARQICKKAGLVLKVKEPIGREFSYFRPWQLLFTYFHFASSRQLTVKMKKTKATCIAYETVEKNSGTPLLKPIK